MTITLYDFWRSSAAYRVRIGLGLAGLDWQPVEVNLIEGAQRAPGYMAINPQGLVPVIEIDGHRFTQSLAILEYIDETRNAGFLPDDAPGRARVRALAHAVAMEIHPVCTPRIAGQAEAASNGTLSQADWVRANMRRGLEALERMLDDPATGPFCHGDRPGLADICLVPQVFNAGRWGLDISDLRQITAVAGRLAEVPAFAAAHPDRHGRQG